MDQLYKISQIRFENDYIVLTIDKQTIKLKISEISKKLYNASNEERMNYKISPSGYGIHWNLIDEDLSVNGLLKKANI